MTDESEWPDEVTADELETESEVENESTQSSDNCPENEPSDGELSTASESQDEEENEPIESEENETADEQEKSNPSDDFGEVTLPVRARQVVQISESCFEIPMSQTKDGKKTISMLIDEDTVKIATTTFLSNGSAESVIDTVHAKETLTGYSFTKEN